MGQRPQNRIEALFKPIDVVAPGHDRQHDAESAAFTKQPLDRVGGDPEDGSDVDDRELLPRKEPQDLRIGLTEARGGASTRRYSSRSRGEDGFGHGVVDEVSRQPSAAEVADRLMVKVVELGEAGLVARRHKPCAVRSVAHDRYMPDRPDWLRESAWLAAPLACLLGAVAARSRLRGRLP